MSSNFGHSFMARNVETHQRGVAVFYFKVDGSAVAGGSSTVNGLSIGYQHGVITENGDGDYTIVLNIAGQQFMSVQVTSITDAAVCTVAQVTDGLSFRVKQTTAADGVALADADFWVACHVSYVPDLT